jgi:long-chain acyl-CoA synthetase
MEARRPFPWEKSYPPGIRWDAPIETMPLGDWLARAAARFGDRVALRFRDAAITYRALGDMVSRVAAALRDMPEGRGGVALYLPNSPAHPVTFFGAATAGLRMTQLSPLDPPRALAHKLRDSGARLAVTLAEPRLLDAAARLRAEGLVKRLVVADDALWGEGPPSAPIPPDATPFAVALEHALLARRPEVDKDEVALLQYTGGTTGVPKGAMLTHANLTAAASINTLWASARNLPPDEPERAIHVLPLFHVFALGSLIRHLGSGSELLLRARFDADQCLDDIERFRPTSLAGVPTMWIALANHPEIDRRDLSSLRWASSGGAPLPVEVAARFERITGRRLGGGWGMTETSPVGISHPLVGPSKPGGAGLPLPGIEVQIVALDDPRRVLPPGETGEIRIRGPNVTTGYWNRPEETAAAFVDGFLLTGDIGRMDEDGFVFFTDRKKDMILSGGYNVYPRAIEEAIYEHPDVEECIVVGVPDEYRGQAAKAFVRLRPGAVPLTLEGLREFLGERLGRHELPAALEIRDALPRTPVGKLSKLMLIEEEAAARAAAPD